MFSALSIHMLCCVIVVAALSAPADDVHREAASITGLRWKAPPAHAHAGTVGVSEESAAEDIGELSLADVSALGLQRSVTVRKRPKAVSSEELEERAGAAGASQDIALPLTDGSAAEDVEKLSLADVSVLGLQRSVIVRKRPKAVGSQKLEHAGAAGVFKAIVLTLTDGSPAEDVAKLSFADVSVLGLQRSAIVRKRRDASSDISWPLQEEVAEAAPSGLSLADVSLLGLQRSAKVVRPQRAKTSPRIADGQRGANMGSASGSVSGSVPGGFMRKAPRIAAEKLS